MNLASISLSNHQEIIKFWNWMDETGRAQIIKFDIPGEQLRKLFDHDVQDFWNTSLIVSLSEHIDEFINIGQDKKDEFMQMDNSQWSKLDGDKYTCYRMFKLLWLARDIKQKNVQEAPVQIFKSKHGYNCHPGSDKRFIITLLQPLESVRCFYIHYPELDPTPYHANLPHTVISDPNDFVRMFYRADHETFTFGTESATFCDNDLHLSDDHIYPFAAAAHRIYKGFFNKEYPEKPLQIYEELLHISYRDAIHRRGMMEQLELLNEIYVDGDTFHLGEFKFVRMNGIWTPEEYSHFPKSLIDQNWDSSQYKTLSI